MVKRRRFDIYNPSNDVSNPEKTGQVPNQIEYDLATPNLSRLENVLLVASDSSLNEALLAKFKWRPQTLDNGKQVATLIGRLTFLYAGESYQFEEVTTYEPQVSPVRLDKITRFGSKASKLRLIVSAPYRRLRLLFTGHLCAASDSQKRVFMKLNCVMNPVSNVFDFLDQYDAGCARRIYDLRKPSMSLSDALANLLIQDRHEHKVRLNGDFLLVDESSNTRTKKVFAYWGFHARHFVSSSSTTTSTSGQSKDLKTKRLYAVMVNGQSFHIGNNQLLPEQSFDFGYTSFEVMPIVKPIDKPFDLDWTSVSAETDKFQFHVSGQGKTFECSGQQVNDQAPQWFKVSTNGHQGWAWLSLDDELTESTGELQWMSESLSRYQSSQSLMRPTAELSSGSEQPIVVAISEPACSSNQLVGSKASSLNNLLMFADRSSSETNQTDGSPKATYKVPSGFVLTKYAHEFILQENPDLAERINQLRQLVAEGQVENLKDTCEQLTEFVDNLRLPEKINDKLVAVFTNYYGNLDKIAQISFAVRSSSWGEDEEDMSAAGQLRTLLNVRGLDAIAKASMACYSSKFSYENIEYKRQHGLPLDLPMAIVIQEMVACEKAGVMFTCDPTNGDDSLITITANYGLGESVVSAQADPDSIRVRVGPSGKYDDLAIEKIDIGEKKLVLTGDQSENGDGNHHYDRSRCCLSDDEILQLARVGLQLRDAFASGQRDIEWGYLDGQLYLFQSRPVTGLESYTTEELLHESERPSQAEKFFYTRANIGEVAPFANTPLNLTYFIYFWNVIGNHLYMRLQKNIEYLPTCASEVFHETYHSYFGLSGSVMLSLSCDSEKPLIMRAMEIAFFGHEIPPQPDIIELNRGFSRQPDLFQGVRYYLETLGLRLMPVKVVESERASVKRLESNVQNIKLAEGYENNKMLGLYNQMNRIFKDFIRCWTNHIYVIKLASANNMMLTGFLSRYIKNPLQLTAASNKFLAITPDVLSAQIPAMIAKIAQLIKSRGQDEIDKFISMPEQDALGYIKNLDNAQDEHRKSLAREFNSFIDRFGHRCYNEFELSCLAWRENPTEIVQMIKQNCMKKSDSPNEDSKLKTYDQVMGSLNIQLGFWDRLLLKYSIVPKCQQLLASREITKDLLVYQVDIARRASRLLAEELRRNMRLPDTNLFYYLMYDEIGPLIRDHQPSIVVQAIRRRKMFKEMFAEPWLYDEIITDLVPNNFKPTKELEAEIANAPKLYGTPASSGRVQGIICLVSGFKEIDKVKPGTILLTHSTDIAFSPIFPLISGIITEVGGLISHGAVVAREYGLPSIIGIPDVTRILQDGEEIILDADNGTITRLNKTNENDETPKGADPGQVDTESNNPVANS